MKRNELTFLISVLVPNSCCPTGRTLTLASQRSEPSSMLQSLTPVYSVGDQIAEAILASDDLVLVRNAREYRAARAAGKHGAFIGVQGGNALDRDLDALDLIPDDVPVLLDAKRGDVGHTSSFYARAAFEELGADAITANFVGSCNFTR